MQQGCLTVSHCLSRPLALYTSCCITNIFHPFIPHPFIPVASYAEGTLGQRSGLWQDRNIGKYLLLYAEEGIRGEVRGEEKRERGKDLPLKGKSALARGGVGYDKGAH